MSDQTTVIIPTWQRAPLLQRLIEALTRQSLRPTSLIIVGRDSDVDARDVAREACVHLDTRWVSVARPGHVAPLIAALPLVETPTFAMTDDDCEPHEQWLEQLVHPFASSEDIACVGGRVNWNRADGRVRHETSIVRWYGRLMSLREAHPRRVSAVAECNWAWRTAIARQLAFDPQLDFEDALLYGVDLCMQASRLGLATVYEPRAVVDDDSAPRATGFGREDIPRRLYVYNRNLAYLQRKHYSRPLRFVEQLWRVLLGERAHYGAASLVIDTVRQRSTGPIQHLRASREGRSAGLAAIASSGAAYSAPTVSVRSAVAMSRGSGSLVAARR